MKQLCWIIFAQDTEEDVMSRCDRRRRTAIHASSSVSESENSSQRISPENSFRRIPAEGPDSSAVFTRYSRWSFRAAIFQTTSPFLSVTARSLAPLHVLGDRSRARFAETLRSFVTPVHPQPSFLFLSPKWLDTRGKETFVHRRVRLSIGDQILRSKMNSRWISTFSRGQFTGDVKPFAPDILLKLIHAWIQEWNSFH